MFITDALARALDKVPEYMRQSVRDYVLHGCPPGDFLRAVLENDLWRAGHKADRNNFAALGWWAGVVDALPLSIWQNPAKVQMHIERMKREREARADVRH